MKTRILVSAMFASAMLWTGSAQAREWIDNTYVGLDIQKVDVHFKTYASVHYKDIYRHSYTGLNVYLGYNIDAMWGVEAGYLSTGDKGHRVNTSTDADDTIVGDASAKIRQWFVDMVGHYELIDNLEFLGTLGMEKTHFRTDNNLTSTATLQGNAISTGIRIGAGLGYDLTHNLGARAMLRCSSSDLHGTARSLCSYSIGLTYLF